MKKIGILNSYFVKLVDDFGYIDWVCIGDLGLFVLNGILKIDLFLIFGIFSF